MIIFKKTLFLLSLTIFISSCNSEETKTQQTEVQTEIEQPKIIAKSLMIIGDNVNVRDKPSTSAKVITKLQKDESFEILDKSEIYETIGTETDYWYRIEKNGEAVWVFGAFTSQNLNDNPKTFVGTYEGTEQGDYFHMIFSNPEKERNYDFGEAFWLAEENTLHNFEQYDLEKEEDKYKGKTFEVTIKVVLQDTYAGEGLMETVKREIPIITNLKLVK